MIKFNELRIAGDKLILDVSVYEMIDTSNRNLFENVYIKRIRICTHEQFVSADSIDKTVFDSNTYLNPLTGGMDLRVQLEKRNTKNIRLQFDSSDLQGSDLNKSLFFVYVECYGAADECVPCTMQKSTDIGIVYNKCPIVSNLINHSKELLNNNNNCEVPTGMITDYLKYKMIEYCALTCNYVEMINYYKQWLGDTTSNSGTVINMGGCGCNR